MKLKSLRAALNPLSKFGQDEISFEISGEGEESTTVYLRPLLPKEEIECQKRAREVLLEAREESEGKEEVSRAAAIQYLDMFRIEVASYALVQVGDQDFRGIKTIELDETLLNGQPVKVPLNKALRDLISETWSRSAITICWSKYGELMTKIARKAEKVVEASVADLDAEIQRLTDRLAKVKAEREERAKGDPTVTMDQIKILTNLGKAMENDVEDTIQRAEEEREFQESLKNQEREFEELRQQPQKRATVIPPVVPPPSAKPPVGPPTFVSSFEDPDSLEGLQQQELEALRTMEARKNVRPEGPRDLSQAEHIGKVPTASGAMLEAYRLPSETISPRGGNNKPASRAEGTPRGNHNPNFVPAKKS